MHYYCVILGMRADASRLWSMLGENMFAPSILQPVKAVESRSPPHFFIVRGQYYGAGEGERT